MLLTCTIRIETSNKAISAGFQAISEKIILHKGYNTINLPNKKGEYKTFPQMSYTPSLIIHQLSIYLFYKITK